MIDVSTASGDEVIEEAKRILAIVRNDKELSTGTLSELINWLCALVIRLGNDAKGIPCMTKAEVQNEITEWAKGVERFLR